MQPPFGFINGIIRLCFMTEDTNDFFRKTFSPKKKQGAYKGSC